MSLTDITDDDDEDASEGVPSNAELAERTARMEEELHYVAETVDRIDERISDEQAELAAQVEDNTKKVGTVYAYHKVVKYGLPLLGAVGSFLGGVVAVGAV